MSIMMGIETAIRGMRTSALAINTAAHNVANMNDEWYSRQLASITASEPYSIVGIAGQIGSGSQISSYERIRSLYLDRQIMSERQKLGMWEMLNATYQNLKAIFPEVDGVSMGLDNQLQKFWDNWQKLADAAQLPDTDPDKADKIKAAQLEIYQTADGMARSFNEKASALTGMQIDMNAELRVAVHDITMYSKQIYELNKEIVAAINLGQTPNDLYDKRNRALNKLSELVNVNVGQRSDGSVVVHIHGHVLVNGSDGFNEMVAVGGTKDSKLEEVGLLEYKGAAPVNIDDFVDSGRLAGIKRSRDEVIHWYRSQLDSMANCLITVVNKIHRTGTDPSSGIQSDIDFFVGNKSSNIVVNPGLNSGLSIAFEKYADGDIAEILANLDNKLVNNSITSTPYLGISSATTLGRDGRLIINGTIVNYSATDTVADLVERINTNVSDFAMVFNDTNQSFFMVGNQLMTIVEEFTGAGVPPQSLLTRFKWMEEQTSTGPVNYSDLISTSRVNFSFETWEQQEVVLDNETTKFGTVVVNFNGQKYFVNWAWDEIPQLTSRKITYFNDPPPFNPPTTPMLDFYSFDNVTQKFIFRSGVNFDNGVTDDTILPFLLTDAQGNMTSVMKIPGNLRFSEFYDTIIGRLEGELDTGENITAEYQAALDQLVAMQDSITSVNEDQEMAMAKQYQRAYDASVRLMSVIDEMLNMLINRTASPSSNWD